MLSKPQNMPPTLVKRHSISLNANVASSFSDLSMLLLEVNACFTFVRCFFTSSIISLPTSSAVLAQVIMPLYYFVPFIVNNRFLLF